MNYIDAETVFPIGHMFDLLLGFIAQAPIRATNTMTRAEVESLITTSKLAAQQSTVPRYDVFNYLLVFTITKLVESKAGACNFDPLFCLWNENRADILRSLKGAG